MNGRQAVIAAQADCRVAHADPGAPADLTHTPRERAVVDHRIGQCGEAADPVERFGLDEHAATGGSGHAL